MLSEKPSMWSLRRLVIQEVAHVCYDIGSEFNIRPAILRIIKVNHPNDYELGCRVIFEKYLERDNPTWEEILESIRQIKLISLADTIERQLPG